MNCMSPTIDCRPPSSVTARLDRYITVDVATGCWPWIGPMDGKGYGKLHVDGQDVQAYVLTYQAHIGAVPTGLELDHLCRNRRCVNPQHLEPVTRRVNQIRGNGFAGINARKTHCHNGHPFDEGNTYWIHRAGKHPQRDCRACRRAASARHETRRKAARS